eukprot:m.23120 g.23120  ORF g.23120 m.23120 type:complete len:300 (+) comp10993_c0_seq1:206-1105(+)
MRERPQAATDSEFRRRERERGRKEKKITETNKIKRTHTLVFRLCVLGSEHQTELTSPAQHSTTLQHILRPHNTLNTTHYFGLAATSPHHTTPHSTRHSALLPRNLACTVSSARVTSSSSTTTDMFNSDAPCAIISTLTPASESDEKSCVAKPTWCFMPSPIALTMARPCDTVHLPRAPRSSMRLFTCVLSTVSCTVRESCVSAELIRSTLTPCLLSSSNTLARKVTEPSIRLELMLMTDTPFLEAIATTPLVSRASSGLRCGSMTVPWDVGVKVLRMWMGMEASMAHSMVKGCSTSLPK